MSSKKTRAPPVAVLRRSHVWNVRPSRSRARGAWRVPRRLERDALGERVEPPPRLLVVEQDRRVEPGDEAAVALDLAAPLDARVAVGVRRVRLDAELAGQLDEAVLRRADPLAADLDHLAPADVVVQGAPADAVARLEHHDRRPVGDRVPRRGEPGQPGPDDDQVHVLHG
jgi:hypothetical protein